MAAVSSLTTLRQTSLKMLGQWESGTATSGSTTSIVAIATSPFISTISMNSKYEDYWIFRPAAAAAADKAARRVKEYASASGQFTVDNPYSAEADGEAIELSGLIEPYAEARQFINDTLKKCWVVTEGTFTPAANNTVQHSLSTLTAITDPDQVLQVGYLTSGESRTTSDPFLRVIRGEASKLKNAVYLNGFSLPTTVTGYVLYQAPAYNVCRASGGTFGDQSGLTATETDEAPVDDEWVAWGVRMLVWDRLGRMMGSGDKNEALQELVFASNHFKALCAQAADEVPDRTFRPIRTMGGGGRRRVVPYPA